MSDYPRLLKSISPYTSFSLDPEQSLLMWAECLNINPVTLVLALQYLQRDKKAAAAVSSALRLGGFKAAKEVFVLLGFE